MKRPAFISILLLFFAFSVYSKVWTLSDSNLEVRFDDQTSLLTVNDKRCNKVWQQSTSQNQFVVSKTVQNGHSLNVIFMGEYPMDVTFSLTPTSALEISLTADENMTFKELAFPSAFKTPDKSHFLLETDGEGLLLPADDQNYPLGNGITYFCGGGLSMAWMGIVDSQFETGYMAILETPYDAAYLVGIRN